MQWLIQNCNPDEIDFPIPGNDDAIRAIALFLDVMSRAIIEGQSGEQAAQIADEDAAEEGETAAVAEEKPAPAAEYEDEKETW